MGMFSSKPPFDLKAFLSEKATSKPGGRRSPQWKAKADPKPAPEPKED